jgi:acyl carrier protein
MEDENRAANGNVGRIAVRSEALAQGYWRDPEATHKAFRQEPGSPRRMFISGDMGGWLPDGMLEHKGRVDQHVKIRGKRVDLVEVEAALRATGLCAEAAVVAREDRAGDCRLVAHVVPAEDADFSTPALRRALRQHTPGALIPDRIVTALALPLTAAGKVDRKALPDEDPGVSRKRGRSMPRDAVELKVARTWEAVLHVPEIGRAEDFFELGGTSLEITQVLSRLEKEFAIALPPSKLIEHSTVEALAAVLAERAIRRSSRSLVPLRTAGDGIPLFLVHNGKGDLSTYGQLVRRLSGRPVYGLQAAGLSGERWPLMSIPGMAGRYADEVTQAFPSGPYLLAGTCTGGFVVFEMARQLAARGRQVAFTAILGPPGAPGIAREGPVARIQFEVRDLFRILRWALWRSIGIGRSGAGLVAYRRFVMHANVRARRWYRPGHFDGTLTLIMPADRPGVTRDPRLLMSAHARETRRIHLSCGRKEMFIPPGVDELARAIQQCIGETERANAVGSSS